VHVQAALHTARSLNNTYNVSYRYALYLSLHPETHFLIFSYFSFMNHSGSKSVLQRMFRSAMSVSKFRPGQRSKDQHALKEHKAIVCESHRATTRGSRTPYHMSHWQTVTLESQPDAECHPHERKSYPLDIHDKSCGFRHNHTEKPSNIPRSRRSFNLDKFIRENESWSPPSPTEDLSRRLFREARQASVQAQNTSNRPSGDYLVHRPLKEHPL
jgi:hypothetical protein